MDQMKTRITEIVAILLLIIVGLAACQIRSESTQPYSTSTPEPGPTKEVLKWATIAPGSIKPEATPTAPPLQYKPEGQIAFQSERDGNYEIYVATLDGTSFNRITNDPAVDVFPAWSPDGKQIVFCSDRNGDPDIFTMNMDGSGLKQITSSKGDDALPAWSPDGKQIAFSSNRDGDDEIYVMDRDGGTIQQLTNNSDMDIFPAWSPDGKRIAFTSNRDVNFEIYVMNKDGSNLLRLTDDPGMDANPAWSPNGTQIAFISNRDGFSNIYLMDSDGQNIRQITIQHATAEKPSWSPDGNFIAYASNLGGNRDIYVIEVNGVGLLRFTDSTLEDFYPAWSSTSGASVGMAPTPTLLTQYTCRVSTDFGYGYSEENPVKLGYDPRTLESDEERCLTWITGPQGQMVKTALLEEIDFNGSALCKVAVTYEGKGEPAILYFDISNYDQPLAPFGFACGSEIEYSKAIAAALRK